ncbi:hypothetical protein [Niabella hibiscisoli]|uniref:hypothetical protein n=1 Tax=Niabella hibiscisoli TaxID=1825928 RepID=UPI001F1132E4|nr:hypothetical protein [Niabella hibiscisoli]MCH5719467.1 hypothetical protein [Niabella hibiscisoli]
MLGAIHGSEFSKQEEFFYLINLRSYHITSKMKVVIRNIQGKPPWYAGYQPAFVA